MNNEKTKKDQNLINLTQLDPAEKEKCWELIRSSLQIDNQNEDEKSLIP